MPNDFKKKEPTKTEKMLYEMFMHQQQLESNVAQLSRVFMDINSRLICLCRAKIEPEVLAKFMLEEPANEAWMKNFNLRLEEEIKKKNEANKTDDQNVAK